jgi:3D (Asp-Asp-Asp) domain-containing protein
MKNKTYYNISLALFWLIVIVFSFWLICFINTAIQPVNAKTSEPLALNSLPVNEDKPSYKIVAQITAYNAEIGQTDDRPFEMANGENVYVGAVACPRRLKFGTAVEILGKMYICKDRMNIRYTNNFDIFMFSYADAIKFGRKDLLIKIYK